MTLDQTKEALKDKSRCELEVMLWKTENDKAALTKLLNRAAVHFHTYLKKYPSSLKLLNEIEEAFDKMLGNPLDNFPSVTITESDE